jgi:hypothetical protein
VKLGQRRQRVKLGRLQRRRKKRSHPHFLPRHFLMYMYICGLFFQVNVCFPEC